MHKISVNEISHAIITAAMRVHTELGPGLLESAYTACLQYELFQIGIRSAVQVGLPVVVAELVIVEINSVDAVSPVHQAQLLSYLKLSGKSLGLLINFNVVHLKDGIKRFVNGTGWK
jgi:GxxExxY protein